MATCTFLDEKIAVTLSVDDWAQVVAAIGLSGLTLDQKDRINTTIYDCVTHPA